MFVMVNKMIFSSNNVFCQFPPFILREEIYSISLPDSRMDFSQKNVCLQLLTCVGNKLLYLTWTLLGGKPPHTPQQLFFFFFFSLCSICHFPLGFPFLTVFSLFFDTVFFFFQIPPWVKKGLSHQISINFPLFFSIFGSFSNPFLIQAGIYDRDLLERAGICSFLEMLVKSSLESKKDPLSGFNFPYPKPSVF